MINHSLSLQKEIEKRKLSLDSEIHTALQALRVKSLFCRSNILKVKGYTTAFCFAGPACSPLL